LAFVVWYEKMLGYSSNHACIIQIVFSCSEIKSLIMAFDPSSLIAADLSKIALSMISRCDNESTIS
jgi:hypothetical protein